MSWLTAVLAYAVIWWIGLFAVLPFFANPNAEPDPVTGWRGLPRGVSIWRIALVNSLVALVLFGVFYWVATTELLSFRHGFLSRPGNPGD